MNPVKPIVAKVISGVFPAPLTTPGVAEPTKNKIDGWSFIKFNK